MSYPRKKLITFAASAFLVLIVIYFVQLKYSEESLKPAQVEHVTCVDLVGGCEIDGITIKFDREPQVMQPFQLKLQTSDAKNIYASIAMVGMQMGINRYHLLQQTPDSWIANITLPICAQMRSDWLMDIEITKPSVMKRYQLSFTSNGGRAHSPQSE